MSSMWLEQASSRFFRLFAKSEVTTCRIGRAWIVGALAALWMLAAPASLVTPALAANTNCSVSGDVANCPTVPTDGIDYESGVKTVNITNGTSGNTVQSGTAGIFLKQSGGDASGVTNTDFGTTTTTTVKIDNNDTTVLATPGSPPTPILVDNGQDYIVVGDDGHGNPTYTVNGSLKTPSELAQLLLVDAPGSQPVVTGDLTVNNPATGDTAASFTTDGADGIHVEAVGGRGGNGGCTTILLATWCDDGGHGGNAGSVAVNNDGSITTTDGYGVSATSTGGAGGNGGGSFGLFASDAGSGGDGGTGGNVSVSLGPDSAIETYGDGAHGVYATSQGGNGGSGGSPSGAIALGDSGGNGGSAGTVGVTNQGSIITHGNGSYGIAAESVGAGAGSGSSSGGIIALGGNGGGQSNGNQVTVTNSGGIETHGQDSFAIFAESVGGGGGDGGNSGGLFSVGGRAGSGGSADLVTVNNDGTLTTHEAGATALFAQSVGGGGGNGGSATSVSVGVSVAIGGDGGLGGNGGQVVINDLTNYSNDIANLPTATITTYGDRANGIQAQSVGGGGGNGGAAISVAVPVQGVDASFAIGGNGGGGGHSDTVTVNESGAITTGGNQSIGIFAQSVGGGGGSGGGTISAAVGGIYNLGVSMGGKGGVAGDGAAVSVNTLGSIGTGGIDSYGIFAQSVGGGGGDGGYALSGTVGSFSGSLSLGGGAGTGGAGKDVTVTSGASISTTGAGAIGILAQSIGGGGGSGGLSGSLAVGGGSVSVALGGSGGSGSNAGKVTVTNSNEIHTTGNKATGILAQSVGGGGGNGGMSIGLNGAAVGASVALGGSGAAGGYGDEVKVTNTGTIITGIHNDATAGIQSYGILAQSVGGGGGNGGMAIAGSLAVSVEDLPAGSAAISIGGKGGGASNGGKVTVDNAGSVETYGAGAAAIYAQSVGGGGGNGGLAGSIALSIPTGGGPGASFAIAVGGSASGGGNGGEVDVNNAQLDSQGHVILAADLNAMLITNAVGADGVHAQSIGGGGGDGGYALAGSFGFSEETSVNVSVAIGGKGGAGGSAGDVNVVNTALIETLADQSNGVFAQSVGGGGGDGGMAITGALSLAEENSIPVGVTVGGGGGTASTGGHVTVDNYGTITTAGKDSAGIFAESVGGTGGNGGLALGVQMSGTTQNAASIGVTVGGKGGDGNTGGEVDVTNHLGATITTTGMNSDGIKAQSVGGGGGTGGLAATAQLGVAQGTEEQATKTLNVGVSVGGSGGSGGLGGLVHVINDGEIDVSGLASTGIFAQSVGGGGGDGGNAVTAIGMVTDTTNKSSRSMGVSVGVGGNGGTGNVAGKVIVDNTGNITTTMPSGYGIFAQSVGGGGGIGGRANTISMFVTDECTLPIACDSSPANSNNMSASFSIGGNGEKGGDGETVNVTNSGNIETSGDASDGIYAQSIGGGGGNGGNGVLGTGEILPVPLESALIPFGSVPIYKNLTVAVGGNNGASGDGKAVEVDNSGNVTTHGSNSNGVTLESVGGGGGIGGKAEIGVTGLVGVGGQGGAAGSGGDVTFNQTAAAKIETFGVSSDGIFAQSIGGGGGVAGNVDRLLPNGAGPIPSINLGIGLAFGQGGGDGGNGGIVHVTTDGAVITHGDSATGVFAESVGGGGGVLGNLGNNLPVLDLLSWHVGSNGDVGNAGAVNVDVTGSIETSGNMANGIFAQSSGGSAGLVNGSGVNGTGGNVTVTVDGSVVTAALLSAPDDGTAANPLRGLGSVGILAQSVGVGGNGDVEVDINSTTGLVQGGRTGIIKGTSYIDPDTGDTTTTADQAVTGIGVEVLDGKDNTVNNHGTVTTFDGVNDGYAILATGSNTQALGFNASNVLEANLGTVQAGGNDTINNYGTVTGSIDLGAGANSFLNFANATFNSGRIANVGVGNSISNSGLMSPGGLGLVMETDVTGDLNQSGTGTYGTDVDFSHLGVPGATDLYTATGTIDMAGVVSLNLLNIGTVKPGDFSSIIAQSDTSFDGTGLALVAPESAVATYVLVNHPKDLTLDYSVDFAPDGLNPNETAIGDYINNVQTAGGSVDLRPAIEGLFNIPTLDQYAKALDQLSPEPYIDNETAALHATDTLENRLMSCKVENGVAKFSAEGQCAWATLDGNRVSQQATTDNVANQAQVAGLAAGVQDKVNDVLRLGGAFALNTVATSTDSSSSTGNLFEAAGVVKAQMGDTVLAAALIGGYTSLDVTRNVDALNGPIYTLTGKQQVGLLSAHLRASHAFANDNFYLRPSVDAGVTGLHSFEVDESGGPIALDIAAVDQLFVTVEPAIEVGGEIGLGDDTVARPFARLGVLDTVSGSSPTASAVFSAAPTTVDGFTVASSIDQYMLDMELGLDVIQGQGAAVRLTGDARLGATTTSYGGGIKVTSPF